MVATLRVAETLPIGQRAHIVRLDLGGLSFGYLPGQAVLVSSQGEEKRTAYSLAASPEHASRDGCLELLIGASPFTEAAVPAWVRQGAEVEVAGPVGRFTFPADCPARYVFIAGGTGIAPIRSMVHHALSRSAAAIVLFYSARTPAEFAYGDELRAYARAGRIDLRQTITRPEGVEDWNAGRGRISAADLQELAQGPDTQWFLCGPPSFVRDTVRLLHAAGVGDDRVHMEDWLRPKHNGE